jgi:hypothetical protein
MPRLTPPEVANPASRGAVVVCFRCGAPSLVALCEGSPDIHLRRPTTAEFVAMSRDPGLTEALNLRNEIRGW